MSGKRCLLILLSTLIASSTGIGDWGTPAPAVAHGRDVADVSVFYAPLTPYGTWITMEEHGRVWIPRDVPPGWRPYTDGRWVYTEAGWTWVSNREWGWAPFHYGRWAFSPHHGWYWVPDTVWGPAWVTWHRSPGWVGWAPLPPSVGFHVGLGLGAVHINVDIAPHWFSFVEERHILAPHVHTFIVPPKRNKRLVHVTKNVTNYVVINNQIVNNSVEVHHIEKVVKRPVVQHRIVEVDAPERASGPRVRDTEREVVLVRPAGTREHRDDSRPDAAEVRERREEKDERQRRHEPLTHESTAVEERQRQGRQGQPEGVAAEKRHKRPEAEREASEETPRRKRQDRRREHVQEERQEDRARTVEEQDRRDRREVRQKQAQEQQEAPRSKSADDTKPRHKKGRKQQPQEEQPGDRQGGPPAN